MLYKIKFTTISEMTIEADNHHEAILSAERLLTLAHGEHTVADLYSKDEDGSLTYLGGFAK